VMVLMLICVVIFVFWFELWVVHLVRDFSGWHVSMKRCWMSKELPLFVSLWMDQSSWRLWARMLGGPRVRARSMPSAADVVSLAVKSCPSMSIAGTSACRKGWRRAM
jgi:hypothetical protein